MPKGKNRAPKAKTEKPDQVADSQSSVATEAVAETKTGEKQLFTPEAMKLFVQVRYDLQDRIKKALYEKYPERGITLEALEEYLASYETGNGSIWSTFAPDGYKEWRNQNGIELISESAVAKLAGKEKGVTADEVRKVLETVRAKLEVQDDVDGEEVVIGPQRCYGCGKDTVPTTRNVLNRLTGEPKQYPDGKVVRGGDYLVRTIENSEGKRQAELLVCSACRAKSRQTAKRDMKSAPAAEITKELRKYDGMPYLKAAELAESLNREFHRRRDAQNVLVTTRRKGGFHGGRDNVAGAGSSSRRNRN